MSSPRYYILSLETSTSYGGVSLLCNGVVLGSISLSSGLRHGKELIPSVVSLLSAHSVLFSDLSGIAVSFGPGSYTGLRIGVITAKTLSYALSCPIYPVSSLLALANSFLDTFSLSCNSTIVCLQDARRDEVYFSSYFYELSSGLSVLSTEQALSPEEVAFFLRSLCPASDPIYLLGGGFSSYPELFSFANSSCNFHTISLSSPTAASVGKLGYQLFLSKTSTDTFSLQPVYLRRSSDPGWRKDDLIKNS